MAWYDFLSFHFKCFFSNHLGFKINKKWSILYTSDSNGLSLNRFTSHLFNYKAPTILLVLCKNGKDMSNEKNIKRQ